MVVDPRSQRGEVLLNVAWRENGVFFIFRSISRSLRSCFVAICWFEMNVDDEKLYIFPGLIKLWRNRRRLRRLCHQQACLLPRRCPRWINVPRWCRGMPTPDSRILSDTMTFWRSVTVCLCMSTRRILWRRWVRPSSWSWWEKRAQEKLLRYMNEMIIFLFWTWILNFEYFKGGKGFDWENPRSFNVLVCVGSFVEQSIDWLIDWWGLVWLSKCPIDWLIDWLIDFVDLDYSSVSTWDSFFVFSRVLIWVFFAC